MPTGIVGNKAPNNKHKPLNYTQTWTFLHKEIFTWQGEKYHEGRPELSCIKEYLHDRERNNMKATPPRFSPHLRLLLVLLLKGKDTPPPMSLSSLIAPFPVTTNKIPPFFNYKNGVWWAIPLYLLLVGPAQHTICEITNHNKLLTKNWKKLCYSHTLIHDSPLPLLRFAMYTLTMSIENPRTILGFQFSWLMWALCKLQHLINVQLTTHEL